MRFPFFTPTVVAKRAHTEWCSPLHMANSSSGMFQNPIVLMYALSSPPPQFCCKRLLKRRHCAGKERRKKVILQGVVVLRHPPDKTAASIKPASHARL